MYWLRLIGGSAAGLAVAAIVYFLIEWLFRGWFDEEGVFITMIAAYSLGGLVGGALAARIGGSAASWSLAALLILLAITSFLAFDIPWWVLPSAIIANLVACFLGSKLVTHPYYDT